MRKDFSSLSFVNSIQRRAEKNLADALHLSVGDIQHKTFNELAELVGSPYGSAWDLFDFLWAIKGKLSFPQRLRASHLLSPDYDDCLRLWSVWQSAFPCSSSNWRANFIGRLKSESAQWQEIMCAGIAKLKQEDRSTILYRFNCEAGSDPLNYLNLCGVPALDGILNTLNETQVRLSKMKLMAEVAVANEGSTLRVVRRLQKELANYKDMTIYDSLFELPKKLEEFALELPKIHTELAARVGLKERNSRAKRRLHTGNEFKFLVNQLIVESYSNMTSMTTEE